MDFYVNSLEETTKIGYLLGELVQPGDIICTGTPEGTLSLKDGDKLEATIEGFGVLKNSVVER